MFDNNIKTINQIIAKTMAISAVAFLLLLILGQVNFYYFDEKMNIIMVICFALCLLPKFSIKLKLNDRFIQYFSLILLSVVLGAAGSTGALGIYILNVLPLIISCFYYDKKFTVLIGHVGYFCMIISLLLNTFNRYEIRYQGWGYWQTFFSYAVGFTFEYIITMLFVQRMLSRAEQYIMKQHEMIVKLNTDEVKHKMLLNSSKDIIFDYDIASRSYSANRSLFSTSSDDNNPIEINDLVEYAKEAGNFSHVIERLVEMCIAAPNGMFIEQDFPIDIDGKIEHHWFQIEGFCIRNEKNEPVTIVAKLHNIDEIKRMQDEMVRNKKSEELYSNAIATQHRSVSNLLRQNSGNLTDKELNSLSRGHRFIAEVLNHIKFATDTSQALENCLDMVGRYFDLNRIVIWTYDERDGNNKIEYHWNSSDKYELNIFSDIIGREDFDMIQETFDRYGFCKFGEDTRAMISDMPILMDFILGNQLWIPTLNGGKYDGAVIFDKEDVTDYSMVDIFLMSEIATTLYSLYNRIAANAASRAKSDFLSTMSHEIRTPMNAIIGMSEVALREDMNDEVRKSLEIIYSSSKGLLAIINDILDFNKIESGKLEIVDEDYESLSIINDFKTIIEARNRDKGLNISFDIPEDLPKVLKGDGIRIKQVMLNLGTNAIKYTDSGSVSFKYSCIRDGEDSCRIKFSVTDTGIGIKKEDIRRLFKSFSQVDQVKNHHKEGTGLGLAISKRLVELMGGQITVDSVYGEGSTFAFELVQKIVDGTNAGIIEDYGYAREHDKDTEMFVAKGSKVLIVDDNEINLVVAGCLLEPLEMECFNAHDGQEAVDMCRKEKYDLILMDHFMPVLDGLQATKIIRSEEGPNKDTPIIAMTADAMAGVQELLMSGGMNDFISKPIVLEKALPILKKYLG